VRFFRIPAFTGIETHRDDADRGSLRVVEGCLPHGPGGLRSGPVWKNKGSVDLFSDSEENHLTASDDGKGNSMLFVSRLDEVHDMAIMSAEHTEVSIFSETYSVVNPVELYREDDAVLTPVGNRLFAFGDGDGEAVFTGKGPPAVKDTKVFPDATLYSQEFSRFPDCKFFVPGPKKTIFAAGNPNRPLTVYISEPAGKTKPYRDSPYSTEKPTGDAYAGQLSTVDILMSNATEITALSSRGDQIVVHTDKGCHILYAPSSDQASTGYRVEQVAATNFSAAVNTQVVAGEAGSMSFWLGHDGQIYKDESASRGAEDSKSFTDPDQASWKAKGLWEKELPTDLSESFSAYDRESGMYWIFVRSDEHDFAQKGELPGKVFLLKALPELPGEVLNLDAASELPGKISLTALPELPSKIQNFKQLPKPGPATNLTAMPEIPSKIIDFTATPELPGKPDDLTATPQIPGKPVVVIANPELPGKPSIPDILPEDPGKPFSLTATPEKPGKPLNLIPIPNTSGKVGGLSATPEKPSKVLELEATPEKPSKVLGLEAEPELPGKVQGLQTGGDVPGKVPGLTAEPDVPGKVLSLTATPEISFNPDEFASDDAFLISAPTEFHQGDFYFHENKTNYYAKDGTSIITSQAALINSMDTVQNSMTTYWPGAASRTNKLVKASFSIHAPNSRLVFVGCKYEGLRDSTDIVMPTSALNRVSWKADNTDHGANLGQHHSWSLSFRRAQQNPSLTTGKLWIYFDVELNTYSAFFGNESSFTVFGQPELKSYQASTLSDPFALAGFAHIHFLKKDNNYPEATLPNNPFGSYSTKIIGGGGPLGQDGLELRRLFVGLDALDASVSSSNFNTNTPCTAEKVKITTPFNTMTIDTITGNQCP
jgi:hypothetical protein